MSLYNYVTIQQIFYISVNIVSIVTCVKSSKCLWPCRCNYRLYLTDPFLLHFENELDEKVAEEMKSCKASKREEIKVHYSVESTCSVIEYNMFISAVWISAAQWWFHDIDHIWFQVVLLWCGLNVMWSYCDVVLFVMWSYLWVIIKKRVNNQHVQVKLVFRGTVLLQGFC